MRQEDKSSVRQKKLSRRGAREPFRGSQNFICLSPSSKAPPRRVLAFLCSLAVGHKRRGTQRIELGRFQTILICGRRQLHGQEFTAGQ